MNEHDKQLAAYLKRKYLLSQPSLTQQAIALIREQGTQIGTIPPGFCAGHPQEVKS